MILGVTVGGAKEVDLTCSLKVRYSMAHEEGMAIIFGMHLIQHSILPSLKDHRRLSGRYRSG